MKRRNMKKFGAAVLTLAMVGTSMSSFAWAEEETEGETQEEETYDFGGQVVKVFGGSWGDLNPNTENPDAARLDMMHQVEEKYNIKFEYAEPDTEYTGYNLAEVVQMSMTGGAGFTNILNSEPDALISMIANGYLTDITDEADQLEIGSLYLEGGTWQGKTYGFSHDNIGDTYVMVYSREFLDDIGMDVTPTEKFMAGEWSYDDMKEYLTEMKAKLPEGIYPIAIHPYHWISMAGAANGYPTVTSDGKINITEEDYIACMEYYNDLINSGLAAPMTIEFDENDVVTGEDMIYSLADMNTKFVIGRAETWELDGLAKSVGDFGITYWPWGDDVTCEGDYTTLSDNYKIAQSYWGTTVTLADAEEQTGIPAITLLQIAKDYYDLESPSKGRARKALYDAEQAGEEIAIGAEIGQARKFTTDEDIELFDWGHNRVVYDWAKAFDNGGISNFWDMADFVIGVGRDGRATTDSTYQQAMAEAVEVGILSEDAE